MDISKYKILNFRRKFLKIVGAEISVTDESGNNEVGVIKMKAWKLKEDIRLFPDRNVSEGSELFRIHARKIIDLGTTYDVYLGQADTPAFALRRKALRSIFVRDKWLILGQADQQVGELIETSDTLAIARRYVEVIPLIGPFISLALAFVKQTYDIRDDSGNIQAVITHQRNPMIVKMQLDQSMASGDHNPHIAIAATALLSVVDAAKN